MLPDLSSHLHTEECNFLIGLYQACRKAKPIAQTFGGCSFYHEAVWQCVTKEREYKRLLNRMSSKSRGSIAGHHLPEELFTPVLKKLKEDGLLNNQSEGCKI